MLVVCRKSLLACVSKRHVHSIYQAHRYNVGAFISLSSNCCFLYVVLIVVVVVVAVDVFVVVMVIWNGGEVGANQWKTKLRTRLEKRSG